MSVTEGSVEMTAIFTEWLEQHTRLFGNHTITLKHSLHTSELFSDEALASLIEGYPPAHYNLHAMGSPDDPRMTWRRGLIDGCPGSMVIDGIREGRLWLNLRNVQEVDPRYRQLLDRMFEEMEAKVPGLRSFSRKLGILISSPRAQVYYHSDIPGQGLWQIRGRKRIWIYPASAPFLREDELEDAVLGLREEDISYEPWYDEYAGVYDLEPGTMMTWGLNAPHRVVNHDCLNISVTTEHMTSEIRKTYAVRYSNALLRNRLGVSGKSRSDGVAVYPKAALALIHRRFFRKQIAALAAPYDFRLTASDSGAVVDASFQRAAE